MLGLQRQSTPVSVASVSQPDFNQIRAQLEKERKKITKSARFRSIIGILAKHGLAGALRGNFGSSEGLNMLGKHLVSAFEELGPTFIKLGQVIATRQELLPKEITEELANTLLDNVPPIPFVYIQTVLEDELPGGMEQMFEWFDAKPLGSASLAQVYRARLKGGRDCAVKVIRPNVDQLFNTDITIIKKLVKLIQKRLPLHLQASLDLPGLINDYYSGTMNELDLRHEARAMDEHRKIAEPFETMHIPYVYFASQNVLIQEFIDGWNLKEFPVDFFTFEERLLRMTDLAHYYIATFLEGYYHGDPHGANIMVDKNTRKCVMIDFGMVGRMDSLHSEAIFRLLLHTRINQAEDAFEAAMDLFDPSIYTDISKYRDQMRSLIIQYVNSEQASNYNWGALVVNLILISMLNSCKIPTGLALWAKGFSAAEGTARWLCPEITFHYVVETADVNIMKSWIARRFNYRANASLMAEVMKLIGTGPRRLNKILQNLSHNNVKFAIDTKIHDSSVQLINKVTNRISLTGLAGAFFVGGSILEAFAVRRVPGAIVPFFANMGLIGSGIISVYLLWRMLRSKRA